MVAATRRWPSAVGWMPSGWFKRRNAGHAVEEERDQRHVVGRGQVPIYGAELAGVRLAEIRGRLHASQDHAHLPGLRLLDDLREIGAQVLRGQAAQPVVGAKRDDQHLHVAGHRPLEAPQAAGRRVAGNTGIHHLEVQPRRAQLSRQLRAGRPRPGERPNPAVRLSPRQTMRRACDAGGTAGDAAGVTATAGAAGSAVGRSAHAATATAIDSARPRAHTRRMPTVYGVNRDGRSADAA